MLDTFAVIGSPGYPLDEQHLRDLALRSYERAHDPGGMQRQLAASSAQANRSRDLELLDIPTVVLHGLDDPLVGTSGGLAIARAIPRATFVGFAGMGHDLPRELWPRFAEEIETVVAAGERRILDA